MDVSGPKHFRALVWSGEEGEMERKYREEEKEGRRRRERRGLREREI